jgi:hypothetical protein
MKKIIQILCTAHLVGPPEIIKKPVSQGVRVGGVATFFCSAGGDPLPSINWRKNGKKVSSKLVSLLFSYPIIKTTKTTSTIVVTKSRALSFCIQLTKMLLLFFLLKYSGNKKKRENVHTSHVYSTCNVWFLFKNCKVLKVVILLSSQMVYLYYE